MPINKLYVEGKLDIETLFGFFQGTPPLKKGGSKNSLKSKVRAERTEQGILAGYVRDRDFDFEPPEDVSRPTVDASDEKGLFGWRWCRLEMENYLLEPALAACIELDQSEFERELCLSARSISAYQAARWTLGSIRSRLPPYYDLVTREKKHENYKLPSDLEQEDMRIWAIDTINAYSKRVFEVLNESQAASYFESKLKQFDQEFTANTNLILLWFSGKDLLAGMSEWIRKKGYESPKAFLEKIREWLKANPQAALNFFPEWQNFIRLLREI